MRVMPGARYWKNYGMPKWSKFSMNNHVNGVDVEVIKVIQLASEVYN